MPGYRCSTAHMAFALLVMVCAEGALAVWPMPQKIRQSSERCRLNPHRFAFQYAEASKVRSGCFTLDRAFERYFTLMFPETKADHGGAKPSTPGGSFVLLLSVREGQCRSHPPENAKESYRLDVSHGQALLVADTVWGALRGLESFSQLVYQDRDNNYYVNNTGIEDFPRFQHRGILLDTSRHFLPIQSILKTLDAMAYNKFNVLHWHIVDDPSFPYQSLTFPELSRKGAFHSVTHVYTRADVMTVVSYAGLRGIRVIPEFDSPAHTQSWGKGQPGLLTPCYRGLNPRGTFGPINPTLGATYQFISSLLKEVGLVFPDTYVHLGGDEVNLSCWKSNPNVTSFMTSMGFGTDFDQLESFYMENLMRIAASLNKTSVVWQDVFELHKSKKLLFLLRSVLVVEVWKQGCYMCEVRRLTAAGVRVILASPWYLDQPGPSHDWSRYYTVRPLNFIGTQEQKKLVIGGEVCMWGEYVDATNLNQKLWPRASAAAERLWSDEDQTSNVAEAFHRLVEFRCKLLRRDVPAEPLVVGHCKQEYQGL